MTPGRELDALVAEKVMGLDVNRTGPETMWFARPMGGNWDDLKDYSTDIAAAWEVVEAVKARKIDQGWFDLGFANGSWGATFRTGAYYEPIEHVRAPTAPHAICLAALKAVETK